MFKKGGVLRQDSRDVRSPKLCGQLVRCNVEAEGEKPIEEKYRYRDHRKDPAQARAVALHIVRRVAPMGIFTPVSIHKVQCRDAYTGV